MVNFQPWSLRYCEATLSAIEKTSGRVWLLVRALVLLLLAVWVMRWASGAWCLSHL
jgi:hypothetical protein